MEPNMPSLSVGRSGLDMEAWPMTFDGILFQKPADRVPEEQLAAPDFFVDLNLDQIVTAITAGKEEYRLTPFFSMPVHEVDAVAFRHEIMRDLEDGRLFDAITLFGRSVRAVREHLGQIEKCYYQRQKERWFLDAVDVYGDAVNRLARDLFAGTVKSRGFQAFREHVSQYTASERFASLVEQTKELKGELSALRYAVLIDGSRVEVRPYQNESDYSAEVEAAFDRFNQGAVAKFAFKFNDSPEMNHVEGQILDLVAQLHHDMFSKLAAYCTANKDFLDTVIVSFDREIQFYVAYLEHIAKFKKVGLHFCYPQVSQSRKEVYARQGFDLALADKLAAGKTIPVTNDFHLEGPERTIVISGPNQGGKTTFARTFGQLHYLASLGCPVPGEQAQLFLSDRIFTHFEREEHMTNLRGKLQDDLVRIHDILEHATPRSIVVINEIFASTTLRDAIFLSKKIAAAITALDLLCVWVTFIDEVASLSEKMVSMVSTVMPDNPAHRTFKVVRRRADGLAYAMSIAEKYRLTHDMIKRRIGS
jgi:DNA mismatch repair protein MutS